MLKVDNYYQFFCYNYNDMSMINRYKFTKNIYRGYIVLIIKNKKYYSFDKDKKILDYVRNNKTIIKIKSSNKRRRDNNIKKINYLNKNNYISYQRYFNSMNNYNNSYKYIK